MDPEIFGTTSSLFINHVTFAGLVVWLIQKVKPVLGKMEWYQQTASQMNRLIGVLMAALATIGIHCDFNPDEGTLLISGLTAVGIAKALWMFLQQYVAQQAMWKGYKVANGVKK